MRPRLLQRPHRNEGSRAVTYPGQKSNGTTAKSPFVMLSGVGAHATTQSKHPEAAGCNNTETGSSTETAVLTFRRRLREQIEKVTSL